MLTASWKKGTTQQEGGGESEPELKSAPGCVSNAKEHGRPDRLIQKDVAPHVERLNPKTRVLRRNDIKTARNIGLLVSSALPEELKLMAAGGDVMETVMTIPFLRACITNMIADLERKSISDGNKTRVLVKPEAPWN